MATVLPAFPDQLLNSQSTGVLSVFPFTHELSDSDLRDLHVYWRDVLVIPLHHPQVLRKHQFQCHLRLSSVFFGRVLISLTIFYKKNANFVHLQSLAGVIAGTLSQFVLPKLGFEVLFLITGCFMALSLIITSLLHCTISTPPRPDSREHYSSLEQ